uniref:Uncharacterized protein n=1 Tax=Setaria italica TaxID=4555 RepID=K3Y3Z8_SETIT
MVTTNVLCKSGNTLHKTGMSNSSYLSHCLQGHNQ